MLDGGYAKWAGEGRSSAPTPETPQPGEFTIRRVTPTVERVRRDGEPRPPDAAARRCACAGALSRRDRAARPGRRATFPARATGPTPHNLNPDGTFKHPAFLRAEFGAILDGVSDGARRAPMRVRRHRVPQPSGDGDRGHPRYAALPRIVERVVCGSGAAGCYGSLAQSWGRTDAKHPSLRRPLSR